jgi:hypothetical protein
MQIRFESSRKEVSQMNTEALRENFLVPDIFENDKINFVYTHYDRVMIGGAIPVTTSLKLETYDALKANYFLERREIGIINIGGDGKITADGNTFEISKLGCVYVGKGTQEVTLSSNDPADPAAVLFAILSCTSDIPSTIIHQRRRDAGYDRQPGNFQPQDHLQIHSSGRNPELAARNGPHSATNRKRLEHHAVARTRPQNGSLLLFRRASKPPDFTFNGRTFRNAALVGSRQTGDYLTAMVSPFRLRNVQLLIHLGHGRRK